MICCRIKQNRRLIIKTRSWHNKAIELKKKGLSNYEIARQIWNKGSKESTLRYFFSHSTVAEKVKTINKAKILYWDIEIAPFLSFHWDKWGINIGNDNHHTEKFMLSHSWAWNDGEIEGCSLTPEEAIAQNDERIVLQAWHLLDEADIVIAHNGKRFDVKVINGYFLRHGFPPPSPYRVVDTFCIAKRKFKLTSNSLAYLAKFLGVTDKLESGGMEAFKQAYLGSKEALDNMLVYNKGDIDTLRQVYYKLRTWDNDGVNMGAYSDHPNVCPNCGHDDIVVLTDKYQYVGFSKYQINACNNCGAKSRARKSTPIQMKVNRVT